MIFGLLALQQRELDAKNIERFSQVSFYVLTVYKVYA